MSSTAAARPLITVYSDEGLPTSSHVKLPDVFKTPIRPDVVNTIHRDMRKNLRMPHGVSDKAGYQTSAESWGTGRAVARIPRVRGGGTHRSGQGAFGNMCRGGRMFAPIKTWRRWGRKINRKERNYALCSAVAATGVPSLVMARGHRIEEIPEVPLVVSDSVAEFRKTRQTVDLLKKLKADEEVARVLKSRQKLRAGKGKLRDRRRKIRRGIVFIHHKTGCETSKAFRNLHVASMNVEMLNVVKLAPGGHVGRFVIWTESAFRKLDEVFGTFEKRSEIKKHFKLPKAIMTNTDLQKITRSKELTSICRRSKNVRPKRVIKKNPFRDMKLMMELNPYHIVMQRKKELQSLINDGLAKDEKLARKGIATLPTGGVGKGRPRRTFAQ